MTKSKGTSEASTLKAIMDYLDGQEILYVRHHPVSPIGRNGSIAFVKVRESQKGVPDLLVWRKLTGNQAIRSFPVEAEVIAVEVKAEKGTLRESQKAWAERARQWGIPYHVVHSLSDFMDIYNE